MSDGSPVEGKRIPVANEELFTVREAMRGLNGMVTALNRGAVEQVVLTRGTTMVAVLLSVERYAELLAGAAPVAERVVRKRAEMQTYDDGGRPVGPPH